MNGNGTPERRRPIEREYLATLNAVVSLDKWRAICEKAADAALAGDARAREWLSKWLLATESRPLTVLAAEESDAAPEAVADAEVTARRGTNRTGPSGRRTKPAALGIALFREGVRRGLAILAKSGAEHGRAG